MNKNYGFLFAILLLEVSSNAMDLAKIDTLQIKEEGLFFNIATGNYEDTLRPRGIYTLNDGDTTTCFRVNEEGYEKKYWSAKNKFIVVCSLVREQCSSEEMIQAIEETGLEDLNQTIGGQTLLQEIFSKEFLDGDGQLVDGFREYYPDLKRTCEMVKKIGYLVQNGSHFDPTNCLTDFYLRLASKKNKNFLSLLMHNYPFLSGALDGYLEQ